MEKKMLNHAQLYITHYELQMIPRLAHGRFMVYCKQLAMTKSCLSWSIMAYCKEKNRKKKELRTIQKHEHKKFSFIGYLQVMRRL